jgi:hypothetical protein
VSESAPATSCPTCGAAVPAEARFCPTCGGALAEGATKVLELPPDETGRVPVNVARATPRLYGVVPPAAALVLGVGALAAATTLFALGRWPYGLILLGVAVLLLLLAAESARRARADARPDAVEAARERFGVALESLALRGRAARELLALRRELQRLHAERLRTLVDLGEAVYGGLEADAERAKARLRGLDELAGERRRQMDDVIAAARQRIDRAQLAVQPTVVAEQPEQPQQPPQPQEPPAPVVPEPARIPEQYPPPDEADPPQPAVIPEPGPAVIPEPGPTGRDST